MLMAATMLVYSKLNTTNYGRIYVELNMELTYSKLTYHEPGMNIVNLCRTEYGVKYFKRWLLNLIHYGTI